MEEAKNVNNIKNTGISQTEQKDLNITEKDTKEIKTASLEDSNKIMTPTQINMPPSEQKEKNTIGNITETTLLNSTQTMRLTKKERETVKSLMTDTIHDPRNKKALFKELKKDYPQITDTNMGILWREAKKDYFHALNRLPNEALLNQHNERLETLTERILEESRRDITFQAEAVNKLIITSSQINKLNEMAPNIQINFHQPISLDKLLNPLNTTSSIEVNITPQDIDTQSLHNTIDITPQDKDITNKKEK